MMIGFYALSEIKHGSLGFRAILKNMLRLIHMYPVTESDQSESGPFVIDNLFPMTVFIRTAPVEDNTMLL